MANAVNLVQAKDTVYVLNGFNALTGLQRLTYNFSADEEEIEEIGNVAVVATSVEPSTSISFEITDTGNLASVLARMTYDYATQDYVAGVTTDITTNVFSFSEADLDNVIFTLGEYKTFGDTFTESVLFPYHFLTSLAVRLTADGIGSITVDAEGQLFKPIYTPYHTTKAYPVQYATATTATINSGWSVNSGTHNILALELNNELVPDTDLSWSGLEEVTVSGGTIWDTEDRLMLWAFELTPGSTPVLDYTNTIKFIKADRINIWLQPTATTEDDTTNYLRVQSLDLTVDLARDELREIAKNDLGSSVFYRATRFPLDITGQIRVYETTLHKWAELQGKTLNESATTGTIDANNVLDISNWDTTLNLVAEWYAVGNNNPVQRLVCSGVTIVGYDATQEVGGRKEATWNISTSQFALQGFDEV